MIPFPFILLGFIVLVMVTRPFTILFHELGHAIPAMLLTRQPVSIYIGSYGDPKHCIHFRIGRLHAWIKYNPLTWRSGMSVPSAKEVSINKKIIYTLTGPLASFSIAIIACYVSFVYDLHGFLKLIFIVFMGSAIFDLIANLNPIATPIKLHNGDLTYNDGYQLKRLFYYKKLPKEYEQAAALYNNLNFKEAAPLFHQMLETGIEHEEIYRLAIAAYFQSKHYLKAKELSDAFIVREDINVDDLIIAAHIHAQLEQYEQALGYYDQSLVLAPENTHVLNNKGYILTLLEEFESALVPLNRAIELDKNMAYAYNNRGLARIKTGLETEGLEDIHYSIQLDADNSYTYRNLGIYHLDKGDYPEALDLFQKAQVMDSDTYGIEALIVQAINKQQ